MSKLLIVSYKNINLAQKINYNNFKFIVESQLNQKFKPFKTAHKNPKKNFCSGDKMYLDSKRLGQLGPHQVSHVKLSESMQQLVLDCFIKSYS